MRTRFLVANVILFIGFVRCVRGGDDEGAPKHEVGLTLGGVLSQTRTSGLTQLTLHSGVALQANYGYRLLGGSKAALYGEVHLLANAQRAVTSSNSALTRDIATLFVTPGLRLKFLPDGRLAPYVAAGAGWALFEHSTLTLGGDPNPATRDVSHGAFNYGGGVDARLWKFIGLRGEVRDFYSGNPSYNVPFETRQHNVVVSGGIVLWFGGSNLPLTVPRNSPGR